MRILLDTNILLRCVEPQHALGMSPNEAHLELAAIQRLFRLLRDERAVYGCGWTPSGLSGSVNEIGG